MMRKLTRIEAILFFVGFTTILCSLLLFTTTIYWRYLMWSVKFGVILVFASAFSMSARQYYREESRTKGYVATFAYIAMLFFLSGMWWK